MGDWCVDIGIINPGEKHMLTIPFPHEFKIVSVKPIQNSVFYPKLEHKDNSIISKELQIKYVVHLPNQKSCEYVKLVTTDGKIITLNLKGQTREPCLTCPKNKLFYYCNGPVKTIKKHTELKNHSDAPASFQFDNDANVSPISISPNTGTVPPKGTLTVLISFTPKTPGLYYKKVNCLVNYQAPIWIEIFGVWSKKKIENELTLLIKSCTPLPVYTNKYDAYLQDCIPLTSHKTVPIISIDKRYIDFGQKTAFKLDSDPRNEGEFFHLKNHSPIDLTVNWHEDSNSVFKIFPKVSTITSGQTVKYSALFYPPLPEHFYVAEIDATVAWGPNMEFIVPFPVAVNLLGNSFDKNHCGWDPQYAIRPQEVCMPPTVPCMTSYTTFTIKCMGHLPLMYKFIPPQHTNYILKPMQGVIYKDQIVIVKLTTGVRADAYYEEYWKLKLNSSQIITVKLSGKAELPSLNIGNKICNHLPVTNIHTEKLFSIPIKNVTSHCISYKIKENCTKRSISVDDCDGELWPNEEISKIFKFCPKYEGMNSESLSFICTCTVSNEHKRETEIVVLFKGICVIASLSVNPPQLNLGDVLFQKWRSANFIIHNISPCEVYVSLECVPRALGSTVTQYCLIPKSFILMPKESIEVELRIRPDSVGLQQLHILYNFHRTFEMNEIIGQGKLFLLNVDLVCIFPIIHILDIRVEWRVSNLSKHYYWQSLQVNKLNKILANLEEEANANVYCEMPDAELGSPPATVQFLVQNRGDILSEVSIKYVKSCDCKPVKESIGISLDRWNYHCLHDDEISITPNIFKLKPREKIVVEMTVQYNTIDPSNFEFTLSVQAESDPDVKGVLSLFITRHCYRMAEEKCGCIAQEILRSTKQTNFGSLYVGSLYFPEQVIWLYNNSGRPKKYKLEEIRSKAFHIHNPKGVVAPVNKHAIFITFNPNMLKTFEAETNLKLGNETWKIIMKGDGSSDNKTSTYFMVDKMPLSSLFPKPTSVACSVAHLHLGLIAAHTKINRLIFLKNNTEDIISFHWQKVVFENIVKIKVYPTKGYLSSGEVLTCHVKIQTQSKSARLTCSLTCKTLNQTQYEKWKDYAKLFRKLTSTFDLCFTITEKGTSFPLRELSLEPSEKPQFQNLVIGVSFHVHSPCKVDIIESNLINQLSLLAANSIPEPLKYLNKPFFSGETGFLTDVLAQSMWDLFTSNWFAKSITLSPPHFCYNQILKEENTILPVKAPTRITEALLEEIKYNKFTMLQMK